MIQGTSFLTTTEKEQNLDNVEIKIGMHMVMSWATDCVEAERPESIESTYDELQANKQIEPGQ